MFAQVAPGAILKLTNETGGDTLSIPSQMQGDLHIRLLTSSVDTTPVSFLYAYLDVDGGDSSSLPVEVIEVDGMAEDWIYDRSSFTLPAEISETDGNEYGLISGDSDGPGYPLGSAEYIHDVLKLQSFGFAGFHEITFETGDRHPQAVGPPPNYNPFLYVWPGFPADFPNTLYLGDENSNNPPLILDLITPEPACVGLLVLALIATRRRRRGD